MCSEKPALENVPFAAVPACARKKAARRLFYLVHIRRIVNVLEWGMRRIYEALLGVVMGASALSPAWATDLQLKEWGAVNPNAFVCTSADEALAIGARVMLVEGAPSLVYRAVLAKPSCSILSQTMATQFGDSCIVTGVTIAWVQLSCQRKSVELREVFWTPSWEFRPRPQ